MSPRSPISTSGIATLFADLALWSIALTLVGAGAALVMTDWALRAALALGLLILGLTVLRRRLRPLAHLEAAFRDVLRHDRFEVRLKPRGQDDLATLCRLFDTMSDRLGRRLADDEAARGELDRALTERSEELRAVREELRTMSELRVEAETRAHGATSRLMTREDELARVRRDADEAARAAGEAMTSLQRSEERFEVALERGSDGFWDWDLTNNHVFYAPRFAELLGARMDELGDEPAKWFRRVLSTDLGALQASFAQHLDGATDLIDCVFRTVAGDTTRSLHCRGVAIRDTAGTPVRLAGTLTDVSRLRALEERHRDTHGLDPITGLVGRERFLTILDGPAACANRSILVTRLDDLGFVVDGLGPRAGDQLLSSIAARLSEHLPDEAIIARFEHGAFVMAVETADEAQTREIATQIRDAVAVPHRVGGSVIAPTMSIGIAPPSDDATSVAIDRATQAAADARTTGGVVVAQHDATNTSDDSIEDALRRAIASSSLLVEYQSMVALETGAPTGFEAFVRWEHADHGSINPGRFLEVARREGLIGAIDAFVLREATHQIAAWRGRYPHLALTMSVNCSIEHLLDPEFIHEIRRCLNANDLPPRALRIDISEADFTAHGESLREPLAAIRREGILVALDDFGTGAITLAQVHDLPVDILKLDRALIRDLDTERGGRSVTGEIIAAAHRLGLTVVAEGVETGDQFRHLQTMGCNLAQGFHFCATLPAEDAETTLMQARRAA